MADDRFPSRFAADASLLPHMADLANDRVLIALLGEADYRAASFLDQRLLTDRVGREWRAWNALPDLAAAAPRPAFIFHFGHVGSPLVSRLLSVVGDALPLREPLLGRKRVVEGKSVHARVDLVGRRFIKNHPHYLHLTTTN